MLNTTLQFLTSHESAIAQEILSVHTDQRTAIIQGSLSVHTDQRTAITQSGLSVHTDLQTAAGNTSRPDGCIEVVFDNIGNTLGEDMEAKSRNVKNFMMAFLSLIGGPGNVINMVVFYKQGLKDRVNLCLFVLAFSDEMHIILSMFLHGEQLHLQFTTKEPFGPMATFIINNHVIMLVGFYYVSSTLSAIIATERCLCVLNPLKFRTLFRTRTMAALIVGVCILIFALQAPVAFRYYIGCTYNPASGAVLKTVMEGEFYEEYTEFVSHLESFVFGLGFPVTVMIVVTVTTIITAIKLRHIVTWRADTSSSLSPREVALTKMLVVSSILFIASVSPSALVIFSWLLFTNVATRRQNQNFFMTSVWIAEMFAFVNSSLNIIVYYVMGSHYRETFWALFGRKLQAGNKS